MKVYTQIFCKEKHCKTFDLHSDLFLFEHSPNYWPSNVTTNPCGATRLSYELKYEVEILYNMFVNKDLKHKLTGLFRNTIITFFTNRFNSIPSSSYVIHSSVKFPCKFIYCSSINYLWAFSNKLETISIFMNAWKNLNQWNY